MSNRFTGLAIPSSRDLVFGRAPKPVACGFGLVIGDGRVYPEVNFTLPPIAVGEETWSRIVAEYEEMAEAIVRRAVALKVPGIVLEFELLPPMTARPAWGAEITALLRRHLQQAHATHGLRSALRVTPTDLRDQCRPPELRSGESWEAMRQSFESCAAAGADILSIESVGGKEVHDEALLHGDIRGMVFAVGMLAARDMGWLWDRISAICDSHRGVVAGGDSACGFANTAMQLAHQGMLPETMAAVARAMGAARSIIAFEHGAVGPSKDCAYEGPVIKMIAGVPIAMEGKSASCAHFSPIGNIAAAACDLWSNESVQNVRLLSGSAPEAFTELLAYDCRLMNTAAERGGASALRDWLVASDRDLSPQAAVMTPEATEAIARAIVGATTPYRRTIAAAQTAADVIGKSRASLSRREGQWLRRIADGLASLPADERELIAEMTPVYGRLFNPASYGGFT